MNFENIMNSIRAFVVVVDRDMNIVYSNRGDLRTHIQMPVLIDLVNRIISTRQAADVAETHLAVPLIDKPGLTESDVCVKGAYVALNGEDYAVLTITDITELKKERKSLNETVHEARNEAVAKSSFLANMSHEIRTPLNAILGFSKLLTETTDPERQKKYCSVIETNTLLLQQLINDVLDLTRIESGSLKYEFKKVNVNEVLEAVKDTVKMRVQPGTVLNMVLGMADFEMITDQERLSQVLINMLTNACKFTERGSITFGYELDDENQVYFYVRDTGLGISKEDQDKVFKRFVSQSGNKESVGLGLSICKNIVTTMGGQIGVKSAGVGRGSTFWFTLPLTREEGVTELVGDDSLLLGMQAPADSAVVSTPPIHSTPAGAHTTPAHQAAPAPAPAPAPTPAPTPTANNSGRPVVLIAEDNDSNYLLFESILEDDYTLYHARDGQEALDMLPQVKPDIILMDISMPHMDGYEATRIIRRADTRTPIIAVTAYAFASDKDRIMKTGFNAYVTKPINADRLISEMERLLP